MCDPPAVRDDFVRKEKTVRVYLLEDGNPKTPYVDVARRTGTGQGIRERRHRKEDEGFERKKSYDDHERTCLVRN